MSDEGHPTHRQDGPEACTSYRVDGALVVWDRTNPGAWIRSDVAVPLGETEEDAEALPSV